jgi:Protein involved in formate dehydrogenase formation
MITTPTPPRPVLSYRQVMAEQWAPLTACRTSLMHRWQLSIDPDAARARLRSGRVAYQAAEALGIDGRGDPSTIFRAFRRALYALEAAGVVGGDDALAARRRDTDVASLMRSWLSAEPMPRAGTGSSAAARRAAALAGGAVLTRTSAEVLSGGEPLGAWVETMCPCCGGAPDFAVTGATRAGGRAGEPTRSLICSRCDARWRAPRGGCLGCGADAAPAIAWVTSQAAGSRVMMCGSCGRYLKEPLGTSIDDAHLERLLTAQLDAAAERRGLRL